MALISPGLTSQRQIERGAALRIEAPGAILRSARAETTVFASVDLHACTGLETVRHLGPSSVGLDTFFLSGGDIPEVFLRGCGVPDSFLQYAASLAGTAIGFYSAFLSYSSKDQELAERLHADLQAKGVRCWFAPEDRRLGTASAPKSTGPSSSMTGSYSCCPRTRF